MTTDAVPTRWPRLRSTWWLVIPVAAVAWSVVRADDEENARMRRPLMVPEAKLPSGFPPPGPVNEVVLKTYPAHRLARVATAGAQGGDGMFMNLFRHIERNEIAMTAPVEMVWEAEPTGVGPGARQPRSMAFLYGRSDLGTPGPDPADPQVVVEDIAEIRVISVGIRGGYGRPALDKGLEMLRAWLAGHPEWVASGSPRTLAYNSPFVPNLLKYSEVQLPVEPAAPGDTTRPQPPPDRR